jgi:hypothetical protein
MIMRIVNLKEFLAMPPGTMFSEYEPCVLSPACIKGDTIRDVDFFYSDISYAIPEMESLIEMENGKAVELDFDTPTRDGSFNEDQLFAIWSDGDRKALIKRLERCEPKGEA